MIIKIDTSKDVRVDACTGCIFSVGEECRQPDNFNDDCISDEFGKDYIFVDDVKRKLKMICEL